MFNSKKKVDHSYFVHRYKVTSCLKDETGDCPNIEVDIEVIGKSFFFIRLSHTSEKASYSWIKNCSFRTI